MSPDAQRLLEEARHLPPAELDWLIENLVASEEQGPDDTSVAEWQKEAGEPEPGYNEWFRAGVEEALADTSPDTPHEEAMKEFHSAIRRARS
jgi:hypothetical protein